MRTTEIDEMIRREDIKISDDVLFRHPDYHRYLEGMLNNVLDGFTLRLRHDPSPGAPPAKVHHRTIEINTASRQSALFKNRSLRHLVNIGLLGHEEGHELFGSMSCDDEAYSAAERREWFPGAPAAASSPEEQYVGEIEAGLQNEAFQRFFHQLRQMLVNLFDDYYCEQMMKIRYPGHYKSGIELAEWAQFQLLDAIHEMEAEGLDPFQVFFNSLMVFCRFGYLKPNPNPHSKLEQDVRSRIEKLEPVILEAKRASDQKARWNAANCIFVNIWDYIKEYLLGSPSQEGDRHEKNQGNGQLEDGGSEEKDQAKQPGASSAPDENEGDAQENGQEKRPAQCEGAGESQGDEDPSPNDGDSPPQLQSGNSGESTRSDGADKSDSGEQEEAESELASSEPAKNPAERSGSEQEYSGGNPFAGQESADRTENKNSPGQGNGGGADEKQESERGETPDENASNAGSHPSCQDYNGSQEQGGADNEVGNGETQNPSSQAEAHGGARDSRSDSEPFSGFPDEQSGKLENKSRELMEELPEGLCPAERPSSPPQSVPTRQEQMEYEQGLAEQKPGIPCLDTSRQLSDSYEIRENFPVPDGDMLDGIVNGMTDAMLEQLVNAAILQNHELSFPDLMDEPIHRNVRFRLIREPEVPDVYIQMYEAIEAEVRSVSKQLQRDIRSAFNDRKRGVTLTGRFMGPHILSHHLYRMEGNFFGRKILPNDIPDLAMGLLVDVSGSTHLNRRYFYEMMAAQVLYDFCVSMELPVMVVGHTEPGVAGNTPIVDLHLYAAFERIDPNDRYRMMGIRPMANNRDGAALRYIGEQMLKRPEPVKLLISLSDGLPHAHMYSGGSAERDVGRVRDELTTQGVKVIAAAIGDDRERIQKCYKESFLDISNLDDLPFLLVGLLKEYL